MNAPAATPPTGIFVSYRRSNASAYAGRIGDRLRAAYPDIPIFMDVESIDAGQDFEQAIGAALAGASHLISLVALDRDGRPSLDRLNDPEDYVRLEIAEALRRGLVVIPVLLDSARMPSAENLPPTLQDYARLNALEVRHTRFEDDVRHLIGVMGGGRTKKAAAPFRPVRAFLVWSVAGALLGFLAAVIANAITGLSLAYMLGGRAAAVAALPVIAAVSGAFGVYRAWRAAQKP